jgi:hypothetical protein
MVRTNLHTYLRHWPGVEAIRTVRHYLDGKQDSRTFSEGVHTDLCSQSDTTRRTGRRRSWPGYHMAYGKCSKGCFDLWVTAMKLGRWEKNQLTAQWIIRSRINICTFSSFSTCTDRFCPSVISPYTRSSGSSPQSNAACITAVLRFARFHLHLRKQITKESCVSPFLLLPANADRFPLFYISPTWRNPHQISLNSNPNSINVIHQADWIKS